MLRVAIFAGALVTVVGIVVSALGGPNLSLMKPAWFVVLVILEAAVLFAVLRPKTYRNSWGRALTAAGLAAVALWFAAQDTLGAPTYVFIHQAWLLAVLFGSLVLCVAGVIRSLRQRYTA
jgi:hypothetical protein